MCFTIDFDNCPASWPSTWGYHMWGSGFKNQINIFLRILCFVCVCFFCKGGCRGGLYLFVPISNFNYFITHNTFEIISSLLDLLAQSQINLLIFMLDLYATSIEKIIGLRLSWLQFEINSIHSSKAVIILTALNWWLLRVM